MWYGYFRMLVIFVIVNVELVKFIDIRVVEYVNFRMTECVRMIDCGDGMIIFSYGFGMNVVIEVKIRITSHHE